MLDQINYLYGDSRLPASACLLVASLCTRRGDRRMSSIYVSEPPTKGKVILITTAGPLDIELWPKESPKAVRNFVQLCVEGYYVNTIFHRIIKSFMVQGGDATGTGTGGESIYGVPFADEFHSRLKFRHRGLVACANAGSPHTNNSQFFISLDRCDWLDRKHTIFGKVTGESIFNLLNLGDIETDKDDRPIDSPPKIISVEVLWNPFDDIIPRQVPGTAHPVGIEDAGKEDKKRTVKKLNLLSFGDEAEAEEKALVAVKGKIKSSHDVLNDPRLLKGESESTELGSPALKRKKQVQTSARAALGLKVSADINDQTDEDEADFDARMRLQILRKRKRMGDSSHPAQAGIKQKAALPDSVSVSPLRISDEIPDHRVVRQEKLALKKRGVGSEAMAALAEGADIDAQLLGPAEQQRRMHKQKRRRLQGREEETLARLEKFKRSLGQSKKGPENVTDEAVWLSHRLQFMADASEKDDMARMDDPDAYIVHDPLLEKGKEKFNKMQAKLKRREREWAGKSIT